MSLVVRGLYGHGFARRWCIVVALFLLVTMLQCDGVVQRSLVGSETRYLALRLQEKGQRDSSSRGSGDWRQAATRKLLGRNATMPLHGAVKDFGYASDSWICLEGKNRSKVLFSL
jgi:hypothetical protein